MMVKAKRMGTSSSLLNSFLNSSFMPGWSSFFVVLTKLETKEGTWTEDSFFLVYQCEANALQHTHNKTLIVLPPYRHTWILIVMPPTHTHMNIIGPS